MKQGSSSGSLSSSRAGSLSQFRAALPARPRTALLALAVGLWFLAAAPLLAAPRPSESFAAIEQQVVTLQPQLVRSTVAIRAAGAAGSGTIISRDGYVLTAAHVSGRPNQRCSVILADGTTYSGLTLGCNPRVDYALVKIEGAADLPVTPLGDSSTLRSGQWVIAAGHPLGPQKGRPPVLRVGRVLGNKPQDLGSTKVITDAPLITGDSGGPLFDLNGRLVGINVMVSGNTRRDDISIHTLINLPKGVLELLKKGETLRDAGGTPPAFAPAWKQAKDQLAAGNREAALRALAQCASLDPTSAWVPLLAARAQLRAGQASDALASIEQACDLGFNDAEALRGDSEFSALSTAPRFRQVLSRLDLRGALPGERRDDRQMVAAAARLAPEMSRGTARVTAGGRDVALGLVMSRSGDVLTKASELPNGELTCVLSDGRAARVTRRTVDGRWDVALLQLQATNTQPVVFAETASAGQWAFTPYPDGSMLCTGIIGVASMAVRGHGIGRSPRNAGFLGVRMDDAAPESVRPHGLKGGVAVTVEKGEYPSAKAGIRTGDVIYQIHGRPVTDPAEMSDVLGEKAAGERITVYLARGSEKVKVVATLGPRPTELPVDNVALSLSGPVSQMQGPFETVLHHDTMLQPGRMGGPLLNAQGKCLGMNIARADRTSTYALPGRTTQEIYLRLKSQQTTP